MVDAWTRNDVSMVKALHGPRDQECGRLEWHCVATEWQQDGLAAQSIRALDLQTFQPRVRHLVPATAKRPARNEVVSMFPGYLFALWSDDADWQRVKAARGVAGILHEIGNRDRPAVVPASFMAAIMVRASIQGVVEDISAPELMAALPAGVVVNIMSGPLAGRTGLCEWSSEDRVSLLCEVMGGRRRASLRRDQVEAV